MRNLLLKYNNWCKTWSNSQLVFVAFIIIALGITIAIVSHRLDEARAIIQTLSTK